MDFSQPLPITFILICVVMIIKAHDDLLEDDGAVIFVNGNKAPVGAKDTIDGNTSTCLDIGVFSKEGVIGSWYVDFTDVRSFYEITVQLDSDSIDLSIFVSNSSFEETDHLCATEIMSEGFIKSSLVKMKCITHGRFVMLRMKPRRAFYRSLSICEVSVTGCRDGKFGKNCSRSCPENCVGKSCDILEGKCLNRLCSDGQESKHALITDENNNTTEYALWVFITISTIVNSIFLVMYIRRFHKTRKDESHGKQTPVYLNISNGKNKDNKPPDGEQLDKSNVTYEVLGAPSSETHYDALQ